MNRSRLATRMAAYDKRSARGYSAVVSEGDSWFDYPNYANLIDSLENRTRYAYYRLENSGDTANQMIGRASSVNDLAALIVREKPVFLLFSGGGNDVMARANQLFRRGSSSVPTDYLANTRIDRLISRLERDYRRMIERVSPLCPIFAHGYDYFQPSPEGVQFLGIELPGAGPWIYPAMIDKGIQDGELQRDIVAVLVDRMNHLLESLEKDYPLEFVHMDLRNTLNIELDWENEIHPNELGFEKVAKAVRDILAQRLPALEGERRERELRSTV